MPPKRKAAEKAGAASTGRSAKKTKVDKLAGLTKDKFLEEVTEPIKGTLKVPGEEEKTIEFDLKPSAMTTGNFGWKANGRYHIPVTIDGEVKLVEATWNLNATVLSVKSTTEANGEGSKAEEKAEEEEAKETEKEEKEAEAEADGAE